MYTKSIIQQTIEAFNAKEEYKNSIISLMEKYNIEDNVFVINNKKLYEATKGYFEIIATYDSLDKAVSECNTNMCIRVINNTLFQTGLIRKTISECSEDNQVLDLDRLILIR